MKNVLLIIALVLIHVICQANDTRVRVIIENYQGGEVRLADGYMLDSTFCPIATNEWQLVLDIEKPIFVNITVAKNAQRIYIEPGKEIVVTLKESYIKEGVRFLKWLGSSGDLENENQYLHSNYSYKYVRKDLIGKDANENLSLYQKVIEENKKMIKDLDLSKEFKNLENDRMKYDIYARFLRDNYGCDNFQGVMKELFEERVDLLSLEEYRTYVMQTINFIARAKRETLNYSTEQLRDLLEVIDTYVREPLLVSFLYDKYIYPYVSLNGCEGQEDLKDLFLNNVKNPKRLREFREICASFDKLRCGEKCPDFTFKDIDGKEVSLKDFRGKYVYMDIWHTRCAPCVKLIPYMNELEEKFAGKDIYFVSLSFDLDRELDAWKQMVKKKGMKGIQLHVGENRDWLKLVMPCLITGPRFMLLDKEGRFINANMSYPSDPRTEKFLSDLLDE